MISKKNLIFVSRFNLFYSKRCLFKDGIFGKGKRMKYSEKRIIGYSMDQMFEVVSDVEKYYQFVPYCKKSDIFNKSYRTFKANIVVGFPPLKEAYVSTITVSKPNLVHSVASGGILFNELLTIWKFRPGLLEIPRSCILDFSVSFEFRHALHSQFAEIFFDHIVIMMVDAFLKRAEDIYGPGSLEKQPPKIISYEK